MLDSYSGKTRIFPIIGDPIAQVKSPVTMTRGFEAGGIDAIVVPVHVTPEDVDRVVQAFGLLKNVDGVIATVPHKFAAFRHAATSTERSRILRAANLLRRNPDGSWHADMVDGVSFIRAAQANGCAFQAARTLLVGAGGAGSAIGLEMLAMGVSQLAIHDEDSGRKEALIARLAAAYPGKVTAGSARAVGFDVAVNATPSGMRTGDALPIDAATLKPPTFVADVITAPEITPLLEAAKACGCRISTGVDMVKAAVGIQVDFLLGKDWA